MLFEVASGKYSRTVESNDFRLAAISFLKEILRETKSPKLGEVIHVAIASHTETFFNSANLLKNLNNNQMQIHDG